jgi:hypothetical protein
MNKKIEFRHTGECQYDEHGGTNVAVIRISKSDLVNNAVFVRLDAGRFGLHVLSRHFLHPVGRIHQHDDGNIL